MTLACNLEETNVQQSSSFNEACPLNTPNGRMEGYFEIKHNDKVGSSWVIELAVRRIPNASVALPPPFSRATSKQHHHHRVHVASPCTWEQREDATCAWEHRGHRHLRLL